MLNLILMVAVIFAVLRLVHSFCKTVGLQHQVQNLNREYASRLTERNDVRNSQVEPVFTISDIEDKPTSYDLPVADLSIGHGMANAIQEQETFALPVTDQDWKIYDEPTYLRRGLFLS